jgi:hypothetical protein
MHQENELAEYLIRCSDKNDSSVVYEHIYEARSAEEAAEKAIIGCIRKGVDKENLRIRTDRIYF